MTDQWPIGKQVNLLPVKPQQYIVIIILMKHQIIDHVPEMKIVSSAKIMFQVIILIQFKVRNTLIESKREWYLNANCQENFFFLYL